MNVNDFPLAAYDEENYAIGVPRPCLGDDVFRYKPGSGNDVIADTGGADTIELSDPLHVFSGWNFSRNGNDLVIDFNGQGRLTVTGQFLGAPIIETRALPSGGAPYTFSNLLTGTVDNDVLIGRSSGEVIDGSGGDDLIFGNEGDNALPGAEGADTLRGGTGNDKLDGGSITDAAGDTDFNLATYDNSIAGVTINLGDGASFPNGRRAMAWVAPTHLSISTGSAVRTSPTRSRAAAG